MGFLNWISTTVAPARMRASASQDYTRAFWSGESVPESWVSTLSASGVTVSPELAMTLSAFYCGVTTIAYDLATLPLRAFRSRSDGGKDLVTGGISSRAEGIGSLIYKLQWQPNAVQTSAEFWVSQIAQLLMRNVAYAEITPGPTGFMDQLLPRHPDRVRPERLPSGRLRFRLNELNGGARYITQDEMFVIRDLSADGGLTALSRVAYGANAIGTGLAAERSAAKFFNSGMTAATVATYAGDLEPEDEAALHASISRYAAGVENSFGLMLIPDDIKIANLSIEPDKAQMMLAREWTVYEVARELRISPRKLMARGKAEGYASVYQDSIDHVVNCLRTYAVLIQQSIQRDLVLAKDIYSFVFHLGELLKGDPEQMGNFIEKLIASRAMTPSEIRTTFLDMNPNAALDKLSEGDFRPGTATATGQRGADGSNGSSARAQLAGPTMAAGHARGMLALHDAAVRCCRRERAAVEKIAKKHASDVDGWQAALREFCVDHARFIAETMRISAEQARGYVARHGTDLEARGVIVHTDDWERAEAMALLDVVLESGREVAA